jgi:DNA (cytosine-5)-methyltransferase 1
MGEQVAGAAGYGWLDGVRADLAREGYASRGVDIPACSVDAPHIRQRLYWVACDMAYDKNIAGVRIRDNGTDTTVVKGEGLQRQSGRSDGYERHMADARCEQRSERCKSRSPTENRTDRGEENIYDQRRSDGDMADASSQPGQQDTGSASGDETPHGRTGRHTQQPDGHHGPSSYGEGFWDDHVWLTGSDGKSRRSKPGLPLLAHGVSNRVGRLRAYGNAIVPQVAAEVIKAYMETEI